MSDDEKKKCPGCGDPECPGAKTDVKSMERALEILRMMAETMVPEAQVVILMRVDNVGVSASTAPREEMRQTLEVALQALKVAEGPGKFEVKLN